MAKRHFLMLAKTLDLAKHKIADCYMSEKLEGMRCFWDGGITRGWLKDKVPFANIRKDSRYKHPQFSTGLWTRYGHVIHAPDFFLDTLPLIPLDGELWAGRGNFQQLISISKTLIPNISLWKGVEYKVFDSPGHWAVFDDGDQDEKLFRRHFSGIIGKLKIKEVNPRRTFEEVLDYLKMCPELLLEQIKLPKDEDVAREMLEEKMEDVITGEGEGLILRRPDSYWSPSRSWNLMKYKPFTDAEATVLDYIWAEDGKLQGLMGSARLQMDNGKQFRISGFTDAERTTTEPEWWDPGLPIDISIDVPALPRGSRINFRYRALSDEGIPIEARFTRVKEDF